MVLSQSGQSETDGVEVRDRCRYLVAMSCYIAICFWGCQGKIRVRETDPGEMLGQRAIFVFKRPRIHLRALCRKLRRGVAALTCKSRARRSDPSRNPLRALPRPWQFCSLGPAKTGRLHKRPIACSRARFAQARREGQPLRPIANTALPKPSSAVKAGG